MPCLARQLRNRCNLGKYVRLQPHQRCSRIKIAAPIAKLTSMAAKISQIPRFRFMGGLKSQRWQTSLSTASALEPEVTGTQLPTDLLVKATELSAMAPE